jgi:hypothetical protein
VILDNSTTGARVCEIRSLASSGVAFARSGRYSVAPLPGDQVVVSDGGTTQRLDTAGRVVAAMPHGGTLVADAAGNVFVANIAESTLTVDGYDANFVLQTHATAPLLSDSTLFALSVAPSGAVMAGTIAPNNQLIVTRFRGGAYDWQLFTVGEAVAFDGEDSLVAWNLDDSLHIARFLVFAGPVWERVFTGNARITAMAVDPAHSVIFGGELQDGIDFGGGPLTLFIRQPAVPLHISRGEAPRTFSCDQARLVRKERGMR